LLMIECQEKCIDNLSRCMLIRNCSFNCNNQVGL